MVRSPREHNKNAEPQERGSNGFFNKAGSVVGLSTYRRGVKLTIGHENMHLALLSYRIESITTATDALQRFSNINYCL